MEFPGQATRKSSVLSVVVSSEWTGIAIRLIKALKRNISLTVCSCAAIARGISNLQTSPTWVQLWTSWYLLSHRCFSSTFPLCHSCKTFLSYGWASSTSWTSSSTSTTLTSWWVNLFCYFTLKQACATLSQPWGVELPLFLGLSQFGHSCVAVPGRSQTLFSCIFDHIAAFQAL